MTYTLTFPRFVAFHRCQKTFRHRRFETHWLVCGRVFELERAGVQCQSVDDGRCATAIFAVANHRVANGGHLHTNLVGAPCFEMQFNQRKAAISADFLVVRNRLFAAIVAKRRKDARSFRIFGKSRHNGIALGLHIAFDQSHIGAIRHDGTPIFAHKFL